MYVAILIDVWDVLDVYNYVGGLTDVCGYCTSCLFVVITDICRCPSWCCNCTGRLGVKCQVSWLPFDACRCPMWWMWVSQMILSLRWGLTGVRLVTRGTRWLSIHVWEITFIICLKDQLCGEKPPSLTNSRFVCVLDNSRGSDIESWLISQLWGWG